MNKEGSEWTERGRVILNKWGFSWLYSQSLYFRSLRFRRKLRTLLHADLACEVQYCPSSGALPRGKCKCVITQKRAINTASAISSFHSHGKILRRKTIVTQDSKWEAAEQMSDTAFPSCCSSHLTKGSTFSFSPQLKNKLYICFIQA